MAYGRIEKPFQNAISLNFHSFCFAWHARFSALSISAGTHGSWSFLIPDPIASKISKFVSHFVLCLPRKIYWIHTYTWSTWLQFCKYIHNSALSLLFNSIVIAFFYKKILSIFFVNGIISKYTHFFHTFSIFTNQICSRTVFRIKNNNRNWTVCKVWLTKYFRKYFYRIRTKRILINNTCLVPRMEWNRKKKWSEKKVRCGNNENIVTI